ncbi:MAG: lipopolysaccharide biosynthesis protein [Novosphingobium sp.]|jgi:O-antigen/teichoic acid export membrane protein|nr:lipopolysaccharide biosynthesis protein [Novosphingobium sp.]
MNLKSDAAINSAALAISSGLNFFSIFLWTRLLDPHEFGIYAIVLAAGLFLNALAFEWLRLVGARTLYDSTCESRINPARASALFLLYAIAGTLLCAVLVALHLADLGFGGIGARWWPLIAGLALTEMALAIINTVSRVRQKAWQFFRSMVGRSVLSVALGMGLVIGLRLGAAGAILGVIIAQSLVALGSVAIDPLWRTIRPWRAGREEMGRILRFGAPLVVSCALIYAAGVADRFLIAAQLGTHEAGLYAAPVDLLQKTLVFVMMAINLTAYPALVRAYEDHGAAAASAILERNFLVQLGLGLPAVVGLAALAPGIANLLLGAPYRHDGAMLLPYVGMAALLRCLITFHLMIAFQVTGRMKLMLVPPAVMLVVIVPAAIFAMREWGLAGMALAAVAAQVAAYGVSSLLARRVMNVRILSTDTIKIVASAAAMGLVLLPLRQDDGPLATVLLIAGGGVVYLLAMIVLRVSPVISALRATPLRRFLPASKK